jgi:crossover junction endodeoxyribonuclease RusA
METTPQITELALVLPLPPSINHLYATVNGRRILSRAGRAFKALVVEAVESWLDQNQLPKATLTLFQGHYLSLTMTFYFATALRRDLDSGLKLAQDALCEALAVNDNLVVEIHLSKRVDRRQPRMEVQLRPLPAEHVSLYTGKAPKTRGQVPRAGAPADADKPAELPWLSEHKGRRRRRKGRSLEELATRYQWS